MNPLYLNRESKKIELEKVRKALNSDLTSKRIMEKQWIPEPNQIVGVRLNLNVLKNTGIAVQTIHKGRTTSNGYQKNKGFWHGTVLGYAEAVTLKNAYFNVNQIARELIANNEHSKFAMASIDGNLITIDSEANIDGVEIRFNPKQTHLFLDNNNQAIHFAEEVTIIGHRAYARGIIHYHTPETVPLKAGQAESIAQILNTKNPYDNQTSSLNIL